MTYGFMSPSVYGAIFRVLKYSTTTLLNGYLDFPSYNQNTVYLILSLSSKRRMAETIIASLITAVCHLNTCLNQGVLPAVKNWI